MKRPVLPRNVQPDLAKGRSQRGMARMLNPDLTVPERIKELNCREIDE